MIAFACSIMDTREFEWESQLRFYWDQLPDELMVRQCTGEFGYGYEYMGLNGRLVITPLTDRIYLTISQVKDVGAGSLSKRIFERQYARQPEVAFCILPKLLGKSSL